jgi:hypothetical protein
MSLYDIVSKKNYKIILYAYTCIHYYQSFELTLEKLYKQSILRSTITSVLSVFSNNRIMLIHLNLLETNQIEISKK